MSDLDRYQYGYDQDSNRTWKANPLVGSKDEFYAYDQLNRLAEMQRGTLNGTKTGLIGTPVREMDYALDPTGNWRTYQTKISGSTDLDQTRTQNTVNEVTAIGGSGGTPVWATPVYDAAGNMTSMPQGGVPTTSFTATYDAWNRMTSVSDGVNQVAGYQYDGAGRQVVKQAYTSGVLSQTRHVYFTDRWQNIEERLGTSSAMDRQYSWGVRYVDELICRDDASPRRLYAMQDVNFNLTAICDVMGSVVERYMFDPYGQRTILDPSWNPISGSAYGWNVGSQGLIHDVNTGLIFYRSRLLHPNLGRFLQRDPKEYADTANLYLFVGGNPIVRLDPYGTQASPPSSNPPSTQPTGKMSDADCCKGQSSGDDNLGGVVCCSGQKVICTWPENDKDKHTKKAAADIDACRRAHEQSHVDDPNSVPCDCSTTVPVPPYRQRAKDKRSKDCGEATAYDVEASCLEAAVANCVGDPETCTQLAIELKSVQLDQANWQRSCNEDVFNDTYGGE